MDRSKDSALLSSMIAGAKLISTVTHARPDGDAAGSSAAMACYLGNCCGKDSAAIFPDPVPESVEFVLDGIKTITDREEAIRRLQATDLLICLDFNTASRVEGLEDAVRSCKGRKVLIDHHEEPDIAFFDLCISDTRVSSACELLYDVLMGMPDVAGDPAKLPPATARALMTGMTTDTNNFANSVWPGTLGMASGLLAAGVDREDILDRLYQSERPNRLAAMGEMLSDRMKLLPEGGAVTVLPQSFFDRHELMDGETEGFVNIPLALKGVRLSLLAREEGDHFRVSIRSKKGTSARQLAKGHFHGGGHEQASGGKILMPQDISCADEAEEYITGITARFLQEQATVEN